MTNRTIAYTQDAMKTIFQRFFSAGRENYRTKFRLNGGKDSAIIILHIHLPSIWNKNDQEWSPENEMVLRESYMTLEIEKHGFPEFRGDCTYDPNTGKFESDVLYGFMDDPIVQETFDILCQKLKMKEVNI